MCLHVETFSPQISRMMERIFLGVLSLSGWLLPSTCLLHQYHYVADPKTWTEAQSYCRQKLTDLATIENSEEVNQLLSTVSSLGDSSEVWIGLYNQILWRWSDGYEGSGADYRKWRPYDNEPNFWTGLELCVATAVGGWWDGICRKDHAFICNRGTQLDPEFVLVNVEKSWSSAQSYCRENFTDLATVRNDTENQEILSLASGSYVWIGLFRDPHLYWSDQSNYSFSYFDHVPNPLGSETVLCGVAVKSSGKWRLVPCNRTLPFVCYSIIPTATKQVVKLRIKLEDSSVDLNDPAVKAHILKQLQDRLQQKAAGVVLKWKEQPDGKVFHKEGKSSQKKLRKKTEL